MTDHPARDKLLEAYQTTLEHLKQTWHNAEEHAMPSLKQNMDKAMEKMTELGELSQKEAQTIGGYLEKDLQQAADFLEKSGKVAKDWLKFDLQFAEQKFAELFSETVNMTHLELDEMTEELKESAVWHTGEITGIGILVCQSCGEKLHFKKPGHIPPCPKCAHTHYLKEFA